MLLIKEHCSCPLTPQAVYTSEVPPANSPRLPPSIWQRQEAFLVVTQGWGCCHLVVVRMAQPPPCQVQAPCLASCQPRKYTGKDHTGVLPILFLDFSRLSFVFCWKRAGYMSVLGSAAVCQPKLRPKPPADQRPSQTFESQDRLLCSVDLPPAFGLLAHTVLKTSVLPTAMDTPSLTDPARFRQRRRSQDG